MVKESCDENEFEKYRDPVTQILALTFDVLDTIYAEYPSMKPAELD